MHAWSSALSLGLRYAASPRTRKAPTAEPRTRLPTSCRERAFSPRAWRRLRFLTQLYEKGLAKQTVFVYVEALRALQKFIYLAELPCTGALGRIAVPKIPHRVGDFLTYEQVEQLIAAARSPIELALVELAFATACRISELARIRVEQINWQERTIVVLGKGNKERVVLFGDPAETALLAYLADRTEGFLFRTERRKWIRLLAEPRAQRVVKREWYGSWIASDGQRQSVCLGSVDERSRAEVKARLRQLAAPSVTAPVA